MWETGLVCLTKNFELYAMLDYDSPFTIKMSSPGIAELPRCWTVITPEVSQSGDPEVLIGLSNGNMLKVTREESIDLGVKKVILIPVSLPLCS